MLVAVLALMFPVRSFQVESANWGYTDFDGKSPLKIIFTLRRQFIGPRTESWGGTCRTGQSQSPIDINNTTRELEWLPIRFVGYDDEIRNLKIFNNAHAVQVNLPVNVDHKPRVR